MSHLQDPSGLTGEAIEAIEKQSLRCLYTAAVDLGFDAFEIFAQSSDDPKDIAEDITREMLDRLGGYQVQQRILGNVDYRKARYIILSEFSVRQALFVDSKAEKSKSSATMQMSQLGMAVRQVIKMKLEYKPDNIYLGDAKNLAEHIAPNTIALSVWSPPYHVGKAYERDISFFDWKNLLRRVIEAHAIILKPGAFLAVNIADILCFKDPDMPRIMAENVARRQRRDITREMVVEVWTRHPDYNRRQIAAILGCSEQTVDRRMKGDNIRGGKYGTQTRVKLVGGMLEQYALVRREVA